MTPKLRRVLEGAFPGEEARYFAPTSIGGTPSEADSGATAILDGVKTATSSARWQYPDGRIPFAGALSVLLDGQGRARDRGDRARRDHALRVGRRRLRPRLRRRGSNARLVAVGDRGVVPGLGRAPRRGLLRRHPAHLRVDRRGAAALTGVVNRRPHL
jgi:hypothetical protein